MLYMCTNARTQVAVLPAVEQPRERHDHVRLPPGGRGGAQPLRQLPQDPLAPPQREYGSGESMDGSINRSADE